jgi:hypothetical protein
MIHQAHSLLSASLWTIPYEAVESSNAKPEDHSLASDSVPSVLASWKAYSYCASFISCDDRGNTEA